MRPIEWSTKRSIVQRSPMETCWLLGPARLGVVYRANFPCLQLTSSSPHPEAAKEVRQRDAIIRALCAIGTPLNRIPVRALLFRVDQRAEPSACHPHTAGLHQNATGPFIYRLEGLITLVCKGAGGKNRYE